MLIYEYYCDACSKRFEISQSMHDAPVNSCPECKGSIRRIFSGGSGFMVKGAAAGPSLRTHCGKNQTCCGSSTPCETPSCGQE
jgi:putative FmdB family regulatory protein